MIPRAPQPEDDDVLKARIGHLSVAVALAIMAVAVRVVFLNIIAGDELERLSRENFHSTESIDAPRGRIFDRRGEPLATNRLTFDIVARAFKLEESDLAYSLEQVGEMTSKSLSGRLPELVRKRWSQDPVVLLSRLDGQQAAPILERAANLPGVGYEASYRRYYPDGALAAHLLGHVGAISGPELDRWAGAGYAKRDWVGKSCLERLCEEYLRGTKGEKTVRRDAKGRVLMTYDPEPPAAPGQDVYLTIDVRLQRKADELLAQRPGCFIAMEPNTGAVLAMASYPTYDPNRPGKDIAPGEHASQVDRALQGGYMPGSAFKLVTAYSALKAGIEPSTQETCAGVFHIPNWAGAYHCDVRTGHGTLDMIGAIQRSCNIYFYKMARIVGPARLIAAAQQWGFGEATGIDCTILERRGSLPNPRTMYAGDTLYMAIGQGRLVVTPMQVLRAYSALGNGGHLVRPYVVARIGAKRVNGLRSLRDDSPSSQTVDLPADIRQTLVEGFWRVINMPGGTAERVKFPREWDAAGKTSSAERQGEEETTAWFVCFAPRDNPVIACVALLENIGHGGDFAAPLVKEFLLEYFRLYPRAAPEAGKAVAGL